MNEESHCHTAESPHSGNSHFTLELSSDGRLVSVSMNGEKLLDVTQTSAGVTQHMSNTKDHSPPASKCTEIRQESRRFLKIILTETALSTLAVMFLQMLAYEIFFHDTTFANRYLWWFFYLDLTAAALITTIGYLRSFIYANISHMMGMLIGMTIGMQVGTMAGAVVGATNGFFIGSMTGMVMGVLSGTITAWCCGPMAVIHGLMAGVMGGTMGAMVVVMMIPDHVMIFMPVFTLLNIAILVWFTYLFHQECSQLPTIQTRRPMGMLATLAVNVLAVGTVSGLMVYGPKGPMVWSGKPIHAGTGQHSDHGGSNPFSASEFSKPPNNDAAPEMVCGAMMNMNNE
ncbi:MAG: hypothetical protein RIQ52_1980, partial [Pseudomonadota bacterium]|jgi:hypothetical protein